jgi:pimeloyl-ACP methyl ester carboxylesterase
MTAARRAAGAIAVALAAIVVATGADSTTSDAPLPPSVNVTPEPDSGRTTDPRFVALPGATAEFGRLGGAVFQIEMPDRWNGALVMWMHGYEEFADAAQVGPPDFRSYLVAQGYAWAASSYSSTSFIPGRAADETAALWDHFVAEHGRPHRTYVTGMSMGGWATHIAAERYGNRYDGALALCGAAGTDAGLAIAGNQLIAGAYVAGITQAELDQADIARLIEDRIKPAIEPSRAHRRFEDLVVALTGGPRAFARAGVHREEALNWQRAETLVSARLGPTDPPRLRTTVDGVAPRQFERARIRVPSDPTGIESFAGDARLTGKLAMPLLTMHTTGDGQVPIGQAVALRRIVDRAGGSNRLVQRIVEDPGHCGFTTAEQIDAFRALARWQRGGPRPAGTTVEGDLRRLDRTFGRHRAVRDHTVQFRGRATVDGRPLVTDSMGAAVLHDGLVTACQASLASARGGRFRLPVLDARASAGCGRRGDRVVLWAFTNDTITHSTRAIPWPRARRSPVLSVDFDPDQPQGAHPVSAGFFGEVHTPSGLPTAVGARVEARVGGVRCGVATVRDTGSFVGFIISVVGPDSIPGCTRGAPISFTVAGREVPETARNDPGDHRDALILTLAR